MMSPRYLAPALLGMAFGCFPLARAADTSLTAAIASPTRTPAFAARDAARHPLAELGFFGLRHDGTVVELQPGGGYWTEILAPYLHDDGHYYVVLSPPSKAPDDYEQKLAADPARYGKIRQTYLSDSRYAPDGSADLVLSFRNLHNWLADGTAPTVLAKIRRALKPGGVLGIEDHRGHGPEAQDPKALDGYIQQDYAIKLIEQAGFKFDGSSEINANPRDTAHWPKGVWTLPPTLALGQQNRAYYQSIGEADNFVLRFRKAGS